MSKKTWTFEVDGHPHSVVLDHGVFTGTRRIWLDGSGVELGFGKDRRWPDYGSRHRLRIGSHTVVVEIRTNGLTFSYDLALDGISVTSGQKVDLYSGTDFIGTRSADQSIALTLVVASVILGLAAIIANMHFSARFGLYYPALSYFGPALLVVATYLLLAPKARTSARQMSILEGLILTGLVIILGALFNYLISGKFF